MALSGAMSGASGTAPTVLPRPTPLQAAPLATLVIVGAVVLFFVVTMASETMDFALVCANPRLAIMTPLASYYRVFTSTFAHGSFPHVLFNCLAFTPMASALERSVGTINFAWLFVVGAARCRLLRDKRPRRVDATIASSRARIHERVPLVRDRYVWCGLRAHRVRDERE